MYLTYSGVHFSRYILPLNCTSECSDIRQPLEATVNSGHDCTQSHVCLSIDEDRRSFFCGLRARAWRRKDSYELTHWPLADKCKWHSELTNGQKRFQVNASFTFHIDACFHLASMRHHCPRVMAIDQINLVSSLLAGFFLSSLRLPSLLLFPCKTDHCAWKQLPLYFY